MGGAVSTGVDNDHLIDNLIEAHFITTPLIEKVFRSVDRAFYFLPEFRKAAYKDLAWKHGNLHLSAPCIYSKVLEELNLKPALSFLNIGSGTGYLSTMVGLILGPYGINHGIEIHQDVVDYAYKKLEQFKKECCAVDVFEFCEPVFIVGNGFHLPSDRKYDRIYCGAACPSVFQENIKEYLKIGGVLIVPCEDDLLKFVRKSQNTWEVQPVLQVSFSTLHPPDKKISHKIAEFEETYPPCLQSLCRTSIRSNIRNVCEKDDISLTLPRNKPVRENRRRRCTSERHLVIPIFDNLTNTGAVSTAANNRANGRLNFGRLIFHNYSAAGFQNFIRNLTRDGDDNRDSEVQENDDDNNDLLNTVNGERVVDDVNGLTLAYPSQQTDIDEDDEELVGVTESSTHTGRRESSDVPNIGDRENVTEMISNTPRISKSLRDTDDTSACSSRNRSSVLGENSSNSSGSTADKNAVSPKNPNQELLIEQHDKKTSPRMATKSEDEDDEDDDFCGSQPKKIPKREKLDSGISEESDDGKISASNESSYSESTFSEAMDVESDDSDFSDYSSNETRFSSDLDSNDIKFDTDESKSSVKYRMALEKRIHALPLPNSIKMYLNYDREFKFSC